MAFYEIEFPLGTSSVESVESLLDELGASSITLLNHGIEPVLEPKPGEIRLWHDTWVRALFEESDDQAEDAGWVAKARRLERLAGFLGPQITESARVRAVLDRDWAGVWRHDWTSMRFGRRLWVCPTSAAPPQDPDAVVVRLDPGLAFGTGTHPTTALCLQILDSIPVAGRRVIDYGCGSGILGLAALKLGAAHVTALDLDPQAVVATRENASRNGVLANIDVRQVDETGTDARLQPAFCVMANILAGPLIDLAPCVTAACEPGGHMLLSGLLKTQAHAVTAAYAGAFAMVRVIERDEWCCLYARRGS
jgi:ribosomal protein L11 methyltransferase